MANHKQIVDWKILDALLQFDPSATFCAEYLGMSRSSLERRIAEEHELTFLEYKNKKLDRTRYKLQETAINMALGKDRVMLIFCLKNLSNWSDNVKVDQTNTDKKVYVNVFDNENPIRKDRKAEEAS